MDTPVNDAVPDDPSRTVRAYAAVDLGASSGRVVLGLVDRETVTVHEVHRFPNVAVEQDSVLGWDVDSLFAETLTGLAAAVAECSRRGARLEGIGVDSWGVDFALVDEDGRRTGPVRSHRGVDDPRPLVAARGIDEAEVYATTGVPDQAINTSFQLASAVFGGTHAGHGLLFVPDLWVQLLTGQPGTEPTIASTSQLLDPRVDRWLPELLEAHGVAGIRMPTVFELGTVAGRTTRDITARLGLSAPVPVIRVAGHDTASAFAFARPVERGASVEGLISSGTWSLVGLALGEPLTSEEALAAGFSNERGVDGVVLVRNLSGMWLLQQCLAHWAEGDGAPVPLADLLSTAHARPGHKAVLNVADERLLPPGDMPARIAVLCAEVGRPLDGSRADVVRAVLDSLAEAYADALTEAAALADCTVGRVRVVGGGSRNAVLCQLTADATGLPVTAGPVEASAIGNIAVQAVVSGARSTVKAVYEDLTGVGSESVTYQPRGDRPATTTPKETR